MTNSTANPRLRKATRSDCADLARLIDIAGEGLASYLWGRIAAPGEDPWEIGRQRAARDTGSFSYRNGVVAEIDGSLVGALIGYPIADEPEPVDIENTPPMFVPLQELENLAAGTWYVNALATLPEARGRGVGTALMRCADRETSELGLRGTSLIVSNANDGARRLYDRLGYREAGRRPMIKEQWQNAGENWVLMIRESKQ